MDLSSGDMLLPGLLLLFFGSANGGFKNNPVTVEIHENYNDGIVIWQIDADCTVQYTNDCWEPCTSFKECIKNGHSKKKCKKGKYVKRSCLHSCPYTKTDSCNECELTSDHGDLFQITNSKTLEKKACTAPTCRVCSHGDGCVNYPDEFTVGVACWLTGYDTDGRVTDTVLVTTTDNTPPSFGMSNGALIDVYQANVMVGSVVNEMIGSNDDAGIDDDVMVYSVIRGHQPSYLLGNQLFDLIGTEIQVLSDLTLEFSYTYHMVLQVQDRRDAFTSTITISLHACYQTPNCTSQQDHALEDTFGLWTSHGTTNTLFDMIYPTPTGHFLDFYSAWPGLGWSHVWVGDTLDNVVQDSTTGEIYTTGNLSVYPAYPSKTFTMRVTVSNAGSCHATTCDIDFTIFFKNWPLEHVTLPASVSLHEDTDAEVAILPLLLYDYNYHWQDNVTCSITSISPHENNLFELRNEDDGDGLYSYNSWVMYKLKCQDADCGYKVDNYLCAINMGCLNYDLTTQYMINVTCNDAYDSVTSELLTFNVVENQPPVYSNLAKTVILDINAVAQHDIIFSIIYTDDESEDLHYEYVFTPGSSIDLYAADATGNYNDNLGNITMKTFLWNITTNPTHSVYICGHERRNEICDTLTIVLTDTCGTTPSCNDQTYATDVEFGVGGKLFDIDVNSAASFSGLSFSITSQNIEYFSLNTNTGAIRSVQVLTASRTTTTYTINAFVYDTAACHYGHCTLTLYVDHINYNISITNLPASVEIEEDRVSEQAIYQLTTADQNADDDVDCDVTDITPAQNTSQPALFLMKETFTGSNVFQIYNRGSPGFAPATLQYLVTAECQDDMGSTATSTLIVNILPNQPPQIHNLDKTITVDPYTTASGDIIFTVDATDNEGDGITYACTPASTWIPFTCTDSPEVAMRRVVDFVTETSATYSLSVCVGDAKHPAAACGILTVMFASSQSYPSITNLPATVSIPEDTAVTTPIFTLASQDADVGDTHSYTLVSVNPDFGRLMFSVESTNGLIRTAQAFDFETETSYVLSFTIRDSSLIATSTWSLTVSVTNVNEAPTISARFSSLTIAEGKAVGTSLPDPGLLCSDPDDDDTLTYSLAGGTFADHFSITPHTGLLGVARTWDLEDSKPTSTTVTVACSDAHGLSDSLTLAINIDGVNEFKPVITSTYTTGDVIQLYQNTSLLENLVSLWATDNDQGDDGVFETTLAGVGLGTQYFMVTEATGSALMHLRLRDYMTLPQDKSFTITIKVSDGESDPLHTFLTVSLSYTPTDPATPGRPGTKCVTCTVNGRVLIAAVVIEGLIVVMFVGHAVVSCFNLCPLPAADHDKHTSRRPGRCPEPQSTQASRPTEQSFNTRFRPHAMVGGNAILMTRLSARDIDVNVSDDSNQDDGSDSDTSSHSSGSSLSTQGRNQSSNRSGPSSASSASFPPSVYSSVVSSAVTNTQHRTAPTGLPPPVYASRLA